MKINPATLVILFSLMLLSCGRNPIIEISVKEEIKPRSAFAAILKLRNPHKSSTKINHLKNEVTLYFYTINKAEGKWKRVMIDHGMYVSDSGRELVTHQFLGPNESLEVDFELTPYELMEEGQEYTLRTVYYVGNKKALYDEPLIIEDNRFINTNDWLLTDHKIDIKKLDENDKKALERLKEISPAFNLSIVNNPMHEKSEEILDFIASYPRSSYINRAKLSYVSGIYYHEKDPIKVNNSIQFLEELLQAGSMSHHHEWIREKLARMKNKKI